MNIGTIGHVDHGKTTLAAALSAHYGKSVLYTTIDRGTEGHAHGVPFRSSHIEYVTAARDYAHVDHPSHADHVKALISGEAQLDCTILVVSAVDGAMPQTREHVRLAGLVGVPYVVVFLNECDMADDVEALDLVEEEVREVLTRYGYPGDTVPVVRGSAHLALDGDEKGVEQLGELVTHLDTYAPAVVRGGRSEARALRARFEADIYLFTPDEKGRTAPLAMPSRTSFSFAVPSATGSGTATDVVAAGSIDGPEAVASIMPGDHASVTVTLEDTVQMALGSRFALFDGAKRIGYGVVSKILG